VLLFLTGGDPATRFTYPFPFMYSFHISLIMDIGGGVIGYNLEPGVRQDGVFIFRWFAEASARYVYYAYNEYHWC
jgi:hypothetical protein